MKDSWIAAVLVIATVAVVVTTAHIKHDFDPVRSASAGEENLMVDTPIVGSGVPEESEVWCAHLPGEPIPEGCTNALTIEEGFIKTIENDEHCRYILSAPRSKWRSLIKEAGISCPIRPSTCPVRDDYGKCGSGGDILMVDEQGYQKWTSLAGHPATSGPAVRTVP